MPFAVGEENKKITLLDDGYYMVEYIPLNENYAVRTFIDKDKNVLQNYIDISLENGTKYGMPYYNDLYLDVIKDYSKNQSVFFDDENELKDALSEGIINQEEYELAYNTANKVLNEIKTCSNVFVNRLAQDVEILN